MDYYVTNYKPHLVFYETPARFTWLEEPNQPTYTILVYKKPNELYGTYENLEYSFFTPDQPMEPGLYWYRVLAGEKVLVDHQTFEIVQDAVATPLPNRDTRYADHPEHPRLWLDKHGIEDLKKTSTSNHLELWNSFLEHGVMAYVHGPIIPEPEFYPDHIRKIDLWRSMYISCQEVVYTVKHLAIAWRVTGNEQYLRKAKSTLLSVANWDLEGPTARSYNDEAGFRVLVALAWGYDWLFEDLTESERQIVRKTLLLRGRELYGYVAEQIKIHVKLMDSHGVRSLSMALIPAALALYQEEPEATTWLNYVIEYLYTIYSPWGGKDGGWAEGPNYWQSGLSFVTEAMVLLKKAFGLELHLRPFFQNTGDFPLFTYSQDQRFMGFCDMSDLGDYPGPKVGYILRLLSLLSANPNRHYYAWYYDQAKTRVKEHQSQFFNYGWWNFAFEELFFHTQFTPIDSKAPETGVHVTWFKDVDWVTFHKDMANPQEHLTFMMKSSPYGSVSHSHGDQNAFVLHGFGEPLAIQAGYYIGFWSEMHVNFRRHTHSKNGILIDGQGQYAQIYKTNGSEDRNPSAKSQFEQLVRANGKIETCEQFDSWSYCRGNATAAYLPTVPYLKTYIRQVLFYHQGFFVIVDQVELSQKGKINWLLHTLSKMELLDNQVRVTQGPAGLDVYFYNSEMRLSQTNEFLGVDPKEVQEYPPQWHLNAETEEQTLHHEIITILHPYKTATKALCKATQQSGDRVLITYEEHEITLKKNPSGTWIFH